VINVNDETVISEMGSGGFGNVTLVYDKEKRAYYALKIFKE